MIPAREWGLDGKVSEKGGFRTEIGVHATVLEGRICVFVEKLRLLPSIREKWMKCSREPLVQVSRDESIVLKMRVDPANAINLLDLSRGKIFVRIEAPAAL